MKSKLLLLLLAVSVLLAFSGCSAFQSTDPVDPNAKESVVVTIPKGSGTGVIADILKENGLIRSKGGFKKLAKDLRLESQLKAGDYELNRTMSAEEILKKIAAGDVYSSKIKVVIPEGYELKQIEAKLLELKLIDKDAFEDAVANGDFDYAFLKGIPNGSNRLEGFLFPATYQFEPGTSEKDILDKMLSTFDAHFKPEYYKLAENAGMSVVEAVTLASIVEREAKLDSERPTIASVFLNRLNGGKRLESCATVQYALGERKTKLYYKDLEVESPYNTYRHKGLPPGPIASPGAKSIEAALKPAQTDYLFFHTTDKNDGSHIFTKTYQQHTQTQDGVVPQ